MEGDVVSEVTPLVQALESVFGVPLADAGPVTTNAKELTALVVERLGTVGDSDRGATMAMLRAFVAADPATPAATPLAALLPRIAARRRAWKILRRHAFLPSLGLAAWAIGLLWLPVAIGLGLLAPLTYPDFMTFSTFATSGLAFGAMVQFALQRVLGWQFPARLATLGDLADAFVRQGGESLWTPELVAETVRRVMERGA